MYCIINKQSVTTFSSTNSVRNELKLKTKLRGLSPHANYTDRAAAAGR